MHTPPRRLTALAFAATLLGSFGAAHEGDPKILDQEPPYVGPGFRSGEPRVQRGGQIAATQLNFPASGVQLLSWLPLGELGGGKSGNSCTSYTSPGGREYALIGLRAATAFVEVSDPGDPHIVGTVPGPVSLWRDVRTYDQYAYMVSEGGEAIQVVDLTNIDGGVITPLAGVSTGGVLATHTLHVNEASGFLYRAGGGSNGIRIYSLANPASPSFVAAWSDRYVHEVTAVTYTSGPYAGKEIAFACGGFNGGFNQTGVSILDVTNKADIQVIKHFSYSNAGYCHQAWPSEDLQYLYIDDELDEDGGVLTRTLVFDISNLSNPVQLPSFTSPTTAIGHNLYVKGDRIYEANYRAGLRIFDASNPAAPVEIAYFDTWPADDNASFNGLWNTNPYFDSGIVIGSDIEKGLFVWWPGAPLVDIAYPGGTPTHFDPAGQQLAVQLLEQSPGTLVAGTEKLHYDTGAGWISVPLASVGGALYEAPVPALDCGETLRWYVSAKSSNGITWTDPQGGPTFYHVGTAALSKTVVLTDDLESESGWTSGAPDDDATSGKWVRGEPIGSSAQPGEDHSPGGASNCWFTRQAYAGALPGAHDVDGGKVTLISPPLDLSGLSNPAIGYWRWFSNTKDGVQSSDVFVVEVASSSAGPWVPVESVGPTGPESAGGWYHHQFLVTDHIATSATVQVRFVASDLGPDSLVEAAIDDLEVFDVGCPSGGVSVYCTSKATSQGCLPHIGASGTPSAASPSAFDVSASALVNNKNGLLFYGFGSASTPFQGGTLCVAAPVTRTSAQNSGGNPPPDDCSGVYAFDFNELIQSGADPALIVGAVVHAQYWGRDPADASGFGSSLTDALEFTIQP